MAITSRLIAKFNSYYNDKPSKRKINIPNCHA